MESKRASSSNKAAALPVAGMKKEIPSNMVGRIVEKGFSSSTSKFAPSSLPQPTVFPFPVARHRSHGPHWGPLTHERVDDEDYGEDLDDMDLDPVAVSANPVKRKPKKGLDFRKWREFVHEDSIPINQQKKYENSATVSSKEGKEVSGNAYSANLNSVTSHEEMHPKLPMNSTVDPNENGDKMVCDSEVGFSDSGAATEWNHLDFLPVQGSPKDDRTRPQGNGLNRSEDGGGGSSPFMSDIDAENRALLQKMSPDEIAEAQAEIMGRMKPKILEMLKKRGRDKSKKQKDVTLDPDTGRPSCAEHDRSRLNLESKSAQLDEGAEASKSVDTLPTKGATYGPDVGGFPKAPVVPDSSFWNLWTDRVEKARELRFSLDGSVVEVTPPQVPPNDNIPDRNQYTIENVAERDFLRTEGDPGASGYTIKEAVALIRSMVPGQRSLALQLLTSVLYKALASLQRSDVGCEMSNANFINNSVDWQAVWAFALGPEPELVLSLRISLDDNHVSVVLASLKVIQCILSCDLNEEFFNISEKLATYERGICTAPVFRSRQVFDAGFLNGGFWKYSTKLSNIDPFNNDHVDDDDNEEKHTIQDDVVVAGQDVAAGLVRMGILPRLRYLLEMNPVVALEEPVFTILIGLARHSPASASAVMKCPRLVQAAVNRFTKKDTMEIHPSMIRSVTLLKVLAQSDKQNCEDLIKHGIFQDTMWHLYKYAYSLDQWIKSGKEYCRLTSALMVEQLRFWEVCIQYGYCISYFPDFFPVMCLWLSPPTVDKLVERNVLNEYASVAREAYLTLEALAKRLPYLHVQAQLGKQSTELSDDNTECWSWSHVLPMVDLAMKWISLKNNPCLPSVFNQHTGSCDFVIQDVSASGLLWVISAVLHMLSSVFERIAPENTDDNESSRHVPWLPEFVPKVGIEIVKSGWLNFSDASNAQDEKFPAGGRSFVEDLCHLRYHRNYETSLASSCCLNGLIQLVVLIDKYIQMAKSENHTQSYQEYTFSREDSIVVDGIVMQSHNELRSVLNMFMTLVSSEWHDMQSIEMFGRCGPAPGIGLGWGVSGGGFWSKNILRAQTDARLIMDLLQIFPVALDGDMLAAEDINFAFQRINSALGACLVAGPRDKEIVEKALHILLEQPVLKFLDGCVRRSLLVNMKIESFKWEYKEEDYLCFSRVLNSHLRKRWLSIKRKPLDKSVTKAIDNKSNRDPKKIKKGDTLDTIHEDFDPSQAADKDVNCTSLVTEWAHQRLPLPGHWFLSPITTIVDENSGDFPNAPTSPGLTCSFSEVLDVAKSGLFLLLGLEALSSFLQSDVVSSPVLSVPLVWKLHALSMVLLVKMDVLEGNSRDIYRTLQELYGKLLDQSRSQSTETLQGKNETLLLENGKKCGVELLKFKTNVHESYTTFIESLVDQFGAMSYGDEIYGRQVALYLHRSVETPVRLAAWNALSSAYALDLLPPLRKCFAEAEGYLDPVEDDEGILEVYAKSWTSGGLDKAAVRGSVSFTLVLHHLASFIFLMTDDKLSLRQKLVRSLLRDYSRKQQHEGMMLSFVRYKISTSQEVEYMEDSSLQNIEVERRFDLLLGACGGNSSLVFQVEKLKSSM